MKRIEASDQELQALLDLLHFACLHAGRQAANPVAVWELKVRDAKEIELIEPPPANVSTLPDKKKAPRKK